MIKTIEIEIILLLFVHLLSDRNFKNGCECANVRIGMKILFVHCSLFIWNWIHIHISFISHTKELQQYEFGFCVFELMVAFSVDCAVCWLMAVSQKNNKFPEKYYVYPWIHERISQYFTHFNARIIHDSKQSIDENKREKNINTFSIIIFHNSHIWHFSGCKYFSSECYFGMKQSQNLMWIQNSIY